MSLRVHVPIFSDLAPDGFSYKANYLVEFDANSIWYETSLVIAAQAVKGGTRTQYHTFMHIPSEVRQSFEKLGLQPKALEDQNRFRLVDSYSPATGLPLEKESATLSGRPSLPINDPLWLEKFKADMADLFRTGPLEVDKKWLHIDDNTSMFNRYIKEQEVLTVFSNLVFPEVRLLELSAFHSVVTGVWSESFYKQFEAQCDGVIDIKAEEGDGQIDSYVRVRSLRGKTCDSRWRQLRLKDNGEVVLENLGAEKKKEIGISGWLKGPKKK